jgi:hypothetical protein
MNAYANGVGRCTAHEYRINGTAEWSVAQKGRLRRVGQRDGVGGEMADR